MTFAPKPYLQLKKSAIEWIQSLPSHWSEIPLRRLANMETAGRYGADPEGAEYVLPVATTAQIGRNGTFVVSRMPLRGFTQDEAGRYTCRAGDILVVKSSGSAANVISGKAGLVLPSDPKFVFSNFLLRLRARPTTVSPHFLHLLVTCNLTRERVKQMVSTTTYPNLRLGEYYSALMPVPPLDEQAAIVMFLEWANGRLERKILAKRKIVASLNEQKQVIIHRAVTHGLNPSVPMKPSGLSWLGDVPAHWEVRRIKYLLRECDDRSKTGSEPLLSLRMYHGLVLFSEHFNRPPQATSLVGFKIVRPGQIVVNRMQAGNGVIYASRLHGLVSPDYAVFDPIGDVDVEFLGELFRSRTVRAKFRAESKGLGTGTSGFLRLYNDRLGALHVALPPLEEQQQILRGLEVELASANAAIQSLEHQIKLLQEYQTRLVADVVTGKLDVREAASKLPSAGPLEPFDYSSDEDEMDLNEEEAVA